jgi:transketolase
MSVRKKFVNLLHEEMKKNADVLLVLGDLGYGHFDTIRKEFPQRVFNPGAAEQVMVAMSIGMAMDGKTVICYSMTPFLLYRPFEFIRNYIDYEQIPVKLIGAGRDKDYLNLGWSHWATDDQEHMSGFKNITQVRPKDAEEMEKQFRSIIDLKKPFYVNLSR